MSPSSQLLRLLDYPRGDEGEGRKLLERIESAGVKGLSFVAKGYRGVVFKGSLKGKPVAVKVKRSDAGKDSLLEREFSVLEHLERALGPENPAPKPYLLGDGFLVEEWIEGLPFERALELYPAALVVTRALEAAHLLDRAGVEHSELKGEKHLLFDGSRFRVIDFESARFKKRPRNLLQVAGYHLLRREKLLEELGLTREELLSALNRYKESFDFSAVSELFSRF
ncbi:hypothetical protein [Thermovibrio ammonificans]